MHLACDMSCGPLKAATAAAVITSGTLVMWLELSVVTALATDSGPAERHLLGPDLTAAQRPQVIIPPHHWQRAECTGAYTLVGCTVSPGFRFEGFTLADDGFDIPDTA